MRRLDRSRDYATGYDSDTGAVCYSQDGMAFNGAGVPLGAHALEVVAEEPAPQIVQAGDAYEAMHWKNLKAMVEQYGGSWTNAADAKAFLRGQS